MHDNDASAWHYASRGEQHGPVSRDELVGMIRDGRLSDDDLAWSDGMIEWVRIGDLPQLRPAAGSVDPDETALVDSRIAAAPPHEIGVTAATPPIRSAFGHGAHAPAVHYVGFWMRFLAFLIDSVIVTAISAAVILVMVMVLGALGGAMGPGGGSNGANATIGIVSIVFVLFFYGMLFFLPIVYQAWMEGSSLQATVGKLAIGARVVDERGRRISYARSYGRSFGRLISGMIFYIGFIMAAFTERKQGLHDLMAGTFVIRR